MSDADAPADQKLPRRVQSKSVSHRIVHGAGTAALTLLLMAGVMLAAAGLYLREAPINAPPWVRAKIENRIAQELPQAQVSFGEMVFVMDDGWRPRVRLRDVVVKTLAGQEIIRFNEFKATLAARPLLDGQVQPKEILLSGIFANLRHISKEPAMRTISENACFGGTQGVYAHTSTSCNCEMTFGLFLPEEAQMGPVPVLWYLSGLTCTHENAMTKAGLQGWAANAGLSLVFPDTSPRGESVPDDDDYAMGQGAGFYVDASQGEWARHFQMESYITKDLPEVVFTAFDLDDTRQGITGHSMGGHGALTLALKEPTRYRSVSALAPICNPSASDWGTPQLTAYTGRPASHDATVLLTDGAHLPPALIDTGTSDQFYDKLGTAAFAAALAETKSEATLNLRRGYDHSYFFVSTFAPDHVAFHAEHLA